MRIMFWNVRGLGTSHRRSWVKNHILQEDLDLVAIQETIKKDFMDWELKEMAGNKDFSWVWAAAKGHSGGLITGIKIDTFEMEEVFHGNYFLGVLLRQRVNNFRFWCINVYGPAKHEFSMDFILELSGFCKGEMLPILLGGDFNLIRNNRDRNRGQGDQNLMDGFNNFIGVFQLRELFTSGPRFTWSNKQKDPLLIKLDRILVTEHWEMQFTTCFSWAKARIGSDHSPILLNSGENGDSRPRYFFFEDHWFQKSDFLETVRNKWLELHHINKEEAYSVNVWHTCLQGLRKYLRGWNLKMIGKQKEEKRVLSERIKEIDCMAEQRLLSIQEWEERILLEKNLEDILAVEDTFWK